LNQETEYFRLNTVSLHQEAEAERQKAEAERLVVEDERQKAEAERQKAEAERLVVEDERLVAEAARLVAEKALQAQRSDVLLTQHKERAMQPQRQRHERHEQDVHNMKMRQQERKRALNLEVGRLHGMHGMACMARPKSQHARMHGEVTARMRGLSYPSTPQVPLTAARGCKLRNDRCKPERFKPT